MKTRKILITLTLFIGFFTACDDKKKTEVKVETEIINEEKIKTVKDTIDEAEVRRLDSIRQVKEHGHAH